MQKFLTLLLFCAIPGVLIADSAATTLEPLQAQETIVDENLTVEPDTDSISHLRSTEIRSECGRTANVDSRKTLVVSWGVQLSDEIIAAYSRNGFRIEILDKTEDETAVVAEFEKIVKSTTATNLIITMHGALCYDFNNDTLSYVFPGAEPDPYLLSEEAKSFSCDSFETKTKGIETVKLLELVVSLENSSIELVIVDACQQVMHGAVDMPAPANSKQCATTLTRIVAAIQYTASNCSTYDSDRDGFVSLGELLEVQEKFGETLNFSETGEVLGYKNDWALNSCAINYFAENSEDEGGFPCKEKR